MKWIEHCCEWKKTKKRKWKWKWIWERNGGSRWRGQYFLKFYWFIPFPFPNYFNETQATLFSVQSSDQTWICVIAGAIHAVRFSWHIYPHWPCCNTWNPVIYVSMMLNLWIPLVGSVGHFQKKKQITKMKTNAKKNSK